VVSAFAAEDDIERSASPIDEVIPVATIARIGVIAQMHFISPGSTHEMVIARVSVDLVGTPMSSDGVKSRPHREDLEDSFLMVTAPALVVVARRVPVMVVIAVVEVGCAIVSRSGIGQNDAYEEKRHSEYSLETSDEASFQTCSNPHSRLPT
jgi:hypothetical protein